MTSRWRDWLRIEEQPLILKIQKEYIGRIVNTHSVMPSAKVSDMTCHLTIATVLTCDTMVVSVLPKCQYMYNLTVTEILYIFQRSLKITFCEYNEKCLWQNILHFLNDNMAESKCSSAASSSLLLNGTGNKDEIVCERCCDREIQLNTRSAKAVNLTAADFWLSIILNPCIVLTRHVYTFHYWVSTIQGSQTFPHLVPLVP